MVFSVNPTTTKTQAMFESMAIAQNGTSSSAATSASASAASVVASSASAVASSGSASAASSAASSVATGTGQISGDACICAVTCAVGSFPAADVQGLGSFGGTAGGLPASMAETS
jgi:hypothetical protein